MLHFTLIARQSDALALSADTETGNSHDLERHKVTAKNLIRRICSERDAPPYLTVEGGNHHFHILTEEGALFLTMCDSSAAPAIAFSYLEDVAREFLQQYSSQMASVTRPYMFIKFDMYLQKTKKVFSSATSTRNAASLQRQGRPAIVRRSFREVMGYVDPAVKTDASSTTTNIIIVSAITLVVVILIVLLIYILL